MRRPLVLLVVLGLTGCGAKPEPGPGTAPTGPERPAPVRAGASWPRPASLVAGGGPRRPAPVRAGASWPRPASLVAGGGPRRPARGLPAGDARLGRVYAAARAGDGRVVVSTQTGIWAVGADGRLQGLGPLAAAQRLTARLVALEDGAVAAVLHDRPEPLVLRPGAHAFGAVPVTPDARRGLTRLGTARGPQDATTRLADGAQATLSHVRSASELDRRPIALGTSRDLFPPTFQGIEGEEWTGRLDRTAVTLTARDGVEHPLELGIERPETLAPDGAADLLVTTRDRLYSTRSGLREPDVSGLWGGHVGVEAPGTGRVRVTLETTTGGRVLAEGTLPPGAGRRTVALRPPAGTPRADVRVEVRGPGGRDLVARRTVFATPRALTVPDARRVLRLVAVRLQAGFEAAALHGVTACRGGGRTVRCTWLTGGEDVDPSARPVALRLGPGGYVVQGGAPHALPSRPRHLSYGSLETDDDHVLFPDRR